MKNLHTGLVLEGGGIRGIYTAGVLDCFLEEDIRTDALFGVSAGIVNGINYVSGQKGRSLKVNTDYLKDKRYLSIYSLLTTGNIFGVDFCYNVLPNKLLPYDYEAFQKNPTKCFSVVSNLITGHAEYRLCKDMRSQLDYVRASASLPLLSRIVKIDGSLYLDGGVCDSIPLAASMHYGCTKNIVVLTRPKGYRKTPSHMIPAVSYTYRRYPNFVKAYKTRHIRYNRSLDFAAKQEADKTAFVIRPSRLLKVGRLEKNPERIHAMYQLGYNDAKKLIPEIKKFLNQ
jgi:predicted patatin/cPLA2 family phospholipase